MQELIDFIENQEYNFLNKEQLESCNKIQNKAKELIEKEKQQIIDAWNDGNTEAKFDDGIGCNANDYYAIKFNNCKD